jgi:biotin-dependent carboxylase-like uncharacterized protein
MRQLGDAAVLLDVYGGHREAQALARSIRAGDVVPGATTVGVIGPAERLLYEASTRRPMTHEIPIVFDGEDLESLGLSTAEVARDLGGRELEVAWLGFMPGFAYLVGLPDRYSQLVRRASPRTQVPAGAFAVAGGYAGIYPVASPGGWNLLGRTNVKCFDPEEPPHALFQPGDHVRLVATDSLDPLPPRSRRPLAGSGLEVLEAGPLLMIEDLGRKGAGSLGVPRAGAANPCYLRIANTAVGNIDSAAALELTSPTRLRATKDLLLALVGGASLVIDGTRLPSGTVAAAGAGQEVSVGPVRSGARAVLAISGGLMTPSYFNSRSADAVSGIPPGPLVAGDRLEVGARPERARLRFAVPESGRRGQPVRLRAIAGPDEVDLRVLEGTWAVDLQSDRTGVRLSRGAGAPRDAPSSRDGAAEAVESHAVVPGAIQIPPSGEPVILGPDCGPVGGYSVAATVITADLWRIGTLAPADLLEVDLVTLADAAVARDRLERVIAEATSGWYPTTVA